MRRRINGVSSLILLKHISLQVKWNSMANALRSSTLSPRSKGNQPFILNKAYGLLHGFVHVEQLGCLVGEVF